MLIAATLRERITNGDYAAGDLMPTEKVLCQEFGVARTTLRRALTVLETDGLVTTVLGIGRIAGPVGPDTPITAPRPRYRQIADTLQALITKGTLNPGDPLPGEATLAQRYNVARTTARDALRRLDALGLVETVHGKGRFVRQDVPKHPPPVRERPPQAT